MVDTALENKKYRSAKAGKITKHVLTYINLAVLSVIWLFPFVYLIAQSLSKTYIYGNFFPTADQLTFHNYVALFTDSTYPYWRWFLNTLVIALVTAILQTILVLMTSYALSRLRFKGRTFIMKMILILGMFPGFLGMVVILFLLKLLNMNGNIFSLILVYCGGSAMNYYIAKGFFDTIPKSLDGLHRWRQQQHRFLENHYAAFEADHHLYDSHFLHRSVG